MGKFDDKVVVITGANSGVGRCTAIDFAKEGAKVIGTARRADKLEEVKNEIEEFGGVFIPVPGDVTIEEDIDKVFDTAINKFGKVDILVNNAGRLDNQTPVHEMTDDLWDQVIALNLTAPMKTARRAIKEMQKQEEGGNIINVGSTAAINGNVGGAAYTSSKHGLVGLTKNIATMYADSNIRCNIVCPHGIDTPMIAGDIMEQFNEFGNEKTMRASDRATRLSQPEEIAEIIAFFASPEASYISGAVLPADLGFSAF